MAARHTMPQDLPLLYLSYGLEPILTDEIQANPPSPKEHVRRLSREGCGNQRATYSYALKDAENRVLRPETLTWARSDACEFKAPAHQRSIRFGVSMSCAHIHMAKPGLNSYKIRARLEEPHRQAVTEEVW